MNKERVVPGQPISLLRNVNTYIWSLDPTSFHHLSNSPPHCMARVLTALFCSWQTESLPFLGLLEGVFIPDLPSLSAKTDLTGDLTIS